MDNFNKAIELNPKLVDAYLERGQVYKDQDDMMLAISDFNSVIRLTGSKQGHFQRGRANAKLGDYQAAIENFDAMIAQDPDHIPTYIQRALAKNGHGDGQGAHADYEKALALAKADGSSGVIHSVMQHNVTFSTEAPSTN